MSLCICGSRRVGICSRSSTSSSTPSRSRTRTSLRTSAVILKRRAALHERCIVAIESGVFIKMADGLNKLERSRPTLDEVRWNRQLFRVVNHLRLGDTPYTVKQVAKIICAHCAKLVHERKADVAKPGNSLSAEVRAPSMAVSAGRGSRDPQSNSIRNCASSRGMSSSSTSSSGSRSSQSRRRMSARSSSGNQKRTRRSSSSSCTSTQSSSSSDYSDGDGVCSSLSGSVVI